MRTPRFAELTAALLGAVEVGKVEPFEVDGEPWTHGLKVTPADGGHPLYLRVTRASGPGGDNFDEPETAADYEIPADLREHVNG